MDCKGQHDWQLVEQRGTYATLACRRCPATCRTPMSAAEWAQVDQLGQQRDPVGPSGEPDGDHTFAGPAVADLRTWLEVIRAADPVGPLPEPAVPRVV